LLRSRRKSFSIASRAIIRAGNGHQYWSKFSPEKIIEIESIAKEIHELIFHPKVAGPVKTLDPDSYTQIAV
ncbi:MAG: hypothetical protein ACRC2U_07870, partial [Aeromonas sp.]